MHRRSAMLLIFTGILSMVLAAGGWFIRGAGAAPLAQEGTPTPQPAAEPATQAAPVVNMSIADEYCLGCHGEPGQTITLENGDVLDLYVPASDHNRSVHGETGIACVQCHTTVGEYPHPPFKAADRRDAQLQLTGVCQRCHQHQYELSQDSVHNDAAIDGNTNSAVCSDCHTAHEVRRINDPETHQELPEARAWIPERCGLCHNAIYQKYKETVHGAALTEGNPDVPTCIDCHGVHNIANPTTAEFRLSSPEMCGKCHADEEKMSKYGLSTDVLNTYVGDFHGSTVHIFEQQAPGAEVNKAVCYDCHGIHDIKSTKDPQAGLEMQANLLATCQRCHPDATPEFTSSWLSHYIPSPDKYPLVYYVDLFYTWFVPITLAGMLALVALDVMRSILNRRKHGTQAAHTAPEVEAKHG